MTTISSPAKVVLSGVPRIHFYEGEPRCPEDICGPSVLRAVLEYLGEDIGCDHCQPQGRRWGLRCGCAFFMGVMGLSWQAAWATGWNGSGFTPEYLPYNLTEDLLIASGCFAAEHALMWQLWDLAGGNGSPNAWQKFADPAVRRKMAPIILASRDKYNEGAGYIERAIGKD